MTDGVRFIDVGTGRVACQVHGTGDLDFVYVPGLASHLDVTMELSRFRRFVEALNEYGRVIRFDRRGSGLSDPAPSDGDEIWELWLEDLLAVLDHAGSRQAVVIAANDAGPTALLFAATYPSRVRALVLFNTTARFIEAPDYPAGHPAEVAEAVIDRIRQIWGTEAAAALLAPSLAADLPFRTWYARFQRAAGSPSVMSQTLDRILRMDGRGALTEVRCPTLVMHREGYATIGADQGRYLAHVIPDATFELVGGADSLLVTQGMHEIVQRIGGFLGRTPSVPEPTGMFSTVLFTDIVSSTERAIALGDGRWHSLLEEHDSAVRDAVTDHGGRLIKMTGDGVLAIFDAPTRALRCAFDIARRVQDLGIEIRAGLHAGPIVMRQDGDISGAAVNIAARVLGKAEGGEVLVSRSIPDLLADGAFVFEDHGQHDLKGIPDPQQLFAVVPGALSDQDLLE